ncbi:unnamed protein product [Orchesella dallaii]|uniref:Uncharacterized protein n=1 Tax=Orchesella dallaii TaxID=48710 RepID=A0ABP1RKC4_9HEXA
MQVYEVEGKSGLRLQLPTTQYLSTTKLLLANIGHCFAVADPNTDKMANLQDPNPCENQNRQSLQGFLVSEDHEEHIMVLQMFPTAQVSVCRNGTMFPVPIEYGEGYCKYLCIAGVDDKLYYGHHALRWKNPSTRQSQKDSWFFDLVEYFWKIDHSQIRFQIKLNDQAEIVSQEFFLGLYINNLKDTVQKKLSINEMRKLLIVVPLCFPHFHRQCLRQSGIIAGFKEVLVLNEVTAIPFFHLVTSVPTGTQQVVEPPMSSSKRSILVINENSENIDVATFEYYEDADGRKVLEMIGLDGNMYEHEKTEKGIEKKLKCVRYFEECCTGNQMRNLAKDLLQDACDKFKVSGRKLEDLEVVIYCHNQIWISIFLNAIARILGTSIKIYRNHLESVVYAGKSFRHKGVVTIQSQAMPDRILELNAFAFYRRDLEDAFVPDVLLKQGEKLSEDDLAVSLKIGIPSSTDAIVFQRNVTGAESQIGHLKIMRFLYYLYQEIGTSFIVDSSGMLKFNHVYGISSKGSIEVAPQKYFTWRYANLSGDEFEETLPAHFLLPTSSLPDGPGTIFFLAISSTLDP